MAQWCNKNLWWCVLLLINLVEAVQLKRAQQRTIRRDECTWATLPVPYDRPIATDQAGGYVRPAVYSQGNTYSPFQPQLAEEGQFHSRQYLHNLIDLEVSPYKSDLVECCNSELEQNLRVSIKRGIHTEQLGDAAKVRGLNQ